MPLPQQDNFPPNVPRRVKLRSRNSGQRAFAVFVNKTRTEITLEWLDFRGNHVSYKDRMRPQEVMQINTFVGHPWLFYEADSRHPLTTLPDRKQVYMPRGYDGGPIVYRPVHIVSPFSSLQQLCLKFLHVHLVNACDRSSQVFNEKLDKLNTDVAILKLHCDQLKLMERSRENKNIPFYVNASTDGN